MQSTRNSDFLAIHDPKLVQLGTLAEYYFHPDTATTIVKLGRPADPKVIAARHLVYEGQQEALESGRRRLSWEGIIPKEIADTFHKLGRVGNSAVYEDHG